MYITYIFIYVYIYIYIYLYISEIHIGEFIIKSSDCEKLLCIKIDSKLHF